MTASDIFEKEKTALSLHVTKIAKTSENVVFSISHRLRPAMEDIHSVTRTGKIRTRRNHFHALHWGFICLKNWNRGNAVGGFSITLDSERSASPERHSSVLQKRAIMTLGRHRRDDVAPAEYWLPWGDTITCHTWEKVLECPIILTLAHIGYGKNDRGITFFP